jgi:hypothetical protein
MTTTTQTLNVPETTKVEERFELVEFAFMNNDHMFHISFLNPDVMAQHMPLVIEAVKKCTAAEELAAMFATECPELMAAIDDIKYVSRAEATARRKAQEEKQEKSLRDILGKLKAFSEAIGGEGGSVKIIDLNQLEEGEVHDCDNCQEAGSCPVEDRMRAYNAAHKEDASTPKVEVDASKCTFVPGNGTVN